MWKSIMTPMLQLIKVWCTNGSQSTLNSPKHFQFLLLSCFLEKRRHCSVKDTFQCIGSDVTLDRPPGWHSLKPQSSHRCCNLLGWRSPNTHTCSHASVPREHSNSLSIPTSVWNNIAQHKHQIEWTRLYISYLSAVRAAVPRLENSV